MSVVQDSSVQKVLAQIDAELDHARDRLFELLRIPSISTQPEHKPDVQRAAEWLRAQLEELGLTVSIMPTAGHPVVLGSIPDRPARRRRASCFTVITMCSRPIRWSCGTARRSSRNWSMGRAVHASSRAARSMRKASR